ncbi:MAG: cation transporter [Clostridiales bacterium]|nr:cation transporter [Clostridiales bacterium]
MLDAILRRFIPNYGQTHDSSLRERCGLLAGGVGLGLNILLFAVKLCAGVLTGAISVTADAFNNLSDAAGSAVTLAGFKLASQRADERHPFGHGRIEYLAGLGVSLLILLVGVELGRSSLEKIFHPEETALTPLAVCLLLVSIAVKLWMGWFYAALGKRIDSSALCAAATDARSDVLATSAVLLGLLASRLFQVPLDGWLGLLVAAFILHSGWGAARDTLDPLLGTPPDPAMVADIEALVLSHPQILGVHDLVIHDYGPGRRMMSVHAEVPADGSLVELHAVIDRAERELGARFGLEAVIHLDPVERGDPRSDRLRALAEELARELDPAATIHDFRRVGDGQISFDVVVPYDVPLSDEEARQALTEKLLAREPGCAPVIGVDRSHVL